MVPLSFVALSVGLLLPSPSGTLTLTRRDALAAVAATPALLARPAAAPAATAYVPAKDIESIKVSSTYSLTYLRSTGPIHTTTSAIMATHTGARPESEGAQGYGALHRGGPAEACHGPDARLQQLPGHHRSGARAHACHARRACLPRAPNRHTSHATTLPRLNRSPRRGCLPVVRRGTYVTQLPPVQVQRAKVQTLVPLQAAMKAAAAASVSIVVHGIVYGREHGVGSAHGLAHIHGCVPTQPTPCAHIHGSAHTLAQVGGGGPAVAATAYGCRWAYPMSCRRASRSSRSS